MNAPALSQQQIAALSAEERLELISDLWDSLTDVDVPLSAAHEAELDRREATYAEDAAAAQSWAVVRERLRRTLR
jgi:putative addiction module component (TIGR02574 family)